MSIIDSLELDQLHQDLEGARLEIAKLRAQLPTSMQDCTIVFKQCRKGHGWLTATNWVQHDCVFCKISRLKKLVSKL